MKRTKFLRRTILALGAVGLILGGSTMSRPASAQVYCPYGYYFVPDYGCAPLSYYYGYPYPYYGYPYYGFDFFYGPGWGRYGWGGHGYGWGGHGYRGGPHGAARGGGHRH